MLQPLRRGLAATTVSTLLLAVFPSDLLVVCNYPRETAPPTTAASTERSSPRTKVLRLTHLYHWRLTNCALQPGL